jgi:hypothetical protein
VKALKVFALSAILVLAAASAEALPILQLDIIGGHYDPATQSIVSDGPDFTLVALLTPNGNKPHGPLLADTYYISAAVSPDPGPGSASLGEFSWNGTNYDVTDDMTYGTPPLDVDDGADGPGDLPSHSVYPTWFKEFEFTFTSANRTLSYDTAVNPGQAPVVTTATTGVSYFATFTVTTALIGSNVLHFDLYNTLLATCKRNQTCTGDIDTELNAPFSHDAQSSTEQVPEPQSILLMSVGLLVAVGLFSLKSA